MLIEIEEFTSVWSLSRHDSWGFDHVQKWLDVITKAIYEQCLQDRLKVSLSTTYMKGRKRYLKVAL